MDTPSLRQRIEAGLAFASKAGWPLGAGVAAVVALALLVVLIYPKRVPVVGIMLPHSQTTDREYYEAFERGMRDLGHIPGKTVRLEPRFAPAGTADAFQSMAKELLDAEVDILVVASTPAKNAACAQSRTRRPKLPIVVATIATRISCDGEPDSENRVTGSTLQAVKLVPKLHELLKMTSVEGAYRRIGLLVREENIGNDYLNGLRKSAPAVTFTAYKVSTPDDISKGFERMASAGEEAVVVAASGFFREYAHRIGEEAKRHALPSILSTENQARHGGLLAYGQSYPEAYQRAAYYVDQLLKPNVRPFDLPVEDAAKIVLAINRETFDVIRKARPDVRLPDELLIRADVVFP